MEQTEPISKGKSLLQFIKFLFVGGCNAVINYAVYSLCYHILGIGYHASNLFGFIVSVTCAFFLQNQFVFQESKDGAPRKWWQVLLKTFAVYIFTGLILTELLLILWLEVIRIDRFLGGLSTFLTRFSVTLSPEQLAASIAPLINMAINIPINFILNKKWAYRQKKQ